MIMDEDKIRIGMIVRAFDSPADGEEPIIGRVESGHAGDWFIRTDEGQLTGPWRADEMTRMGYADEPTDLPHDAPYWRVQGAYGYWMVEERRVGSTGSSGILSPMTRKLANSVAGALNDAYRRGSKIGS